MMDILETIKGSLSSGQIAYLAGVLGESTEATSKAMSGVLPALLGGVVKQGSTQQGASGLIDWMRALPFARTLTDLLGFKDDRLARSGSWLVAQWFDGQSATIASRIGGFAGVTAASAHNLLAMAAPMVLGGVAKAAPAGGYSPKGLMGVLDSQKWSIARAMPAGLSGLSDLIGIPRVGHTAPATPAEAGARRHSLSWLIGAAAVAAALVLGLRMCSTDVAPPGVSRLTLPGGETLSLAPGSIGDQLYRFLAGRGATPKTFTFDQLDFPSGQASYMPGSQPTIDAISVILKAFPGAKVRIEGFTDSDGDAAANQALSKARAESVASALIARGVDASRISAVGLGEKRPIADNNVEAGRAKNRRIELVVTER
jgi:outer membrane protein OmpA-like peptidoglycan-associated protein